MSLITNEYLAKYELQALNFVCGQNQPMRELIQKLLHQQTQSLQLQQRARNVLSGTPSQLPYDSVLLPIVLEKAEGAYLFDVDHNRYIDCNMSNGTMLLGHNPPVVVTSVQEALNNGIDHAALSQAHLALAESIMNLVPDIEKVAYFQTAGEAISAAVRMSRVVTRKNKVVKFEGCYHGANEFGLCNPSMVLSGRLSDEINGEITPHLATGGYPESYTQELIVLSFNTETALTNIARYSDEIACVIVEPMPQFMSNWPEACQLFLANLSDLCQKKQIALIFDESQCGFRLALGGARAWAKVEADISCFEATVSGLGLPLAILAGRSKFLDTASTNGQFMDYALNKVWIGGNSASHYLAIIAAHAQLKLLAQDFDAIMAKLDSDYAYLKEQLKAFAIKTGIPVSLQGNPRLQMQLSIAKQEPATRTYRGVIESSSMPQFRSLIALTYYCRLAGLYCRQIPTINLSAAHTSADLEKIMAAIASSLLQMSHDQML